MPLLKPIEEDFVYLDPLAPSTDLDLMIQMIQYVPPLPPYLIQLFRIALESESREPLYGFCRVVAQICLLSFWALILKHLPEE